MTVWSHDPLTNVSLFRRFQFTEKTSRVCSCQFLMAKS